MCIVWWVVRPFLHYSTLKTLQYWCRTVIGAITAFGGCLAQATPVTLEQVISREHPSFDPAKARLSDTLSGRIYASHGVSGGGFVLEMNLDGTEKAGFPVGHIQEVAAVNREGNYALREAHFAGAVSFYDSHHQFLGRFKNFKNENYDAPQVVEAGESGDFYALDNGNSRIVRLKPSGEAVKYFPVATPDTQTFRVDEKNGFFYLQDRKGIVNVFDFEGGKKGAFPFPTVFDLDENGLLYAVSPQARNAVDTFDSQGKKLSTINLGSEGLSSDVPLVFQQLRVTPSGEILLKREHPYELYRRYDRSTGAFKGAVPIDFENFTAGYTSRVWTAGTSVPLTLSSKPENPSMLRHCTVRMTPFGDSGWKELPVSEGAVVVPADYAGLYQLRVGDGGDFLLQDVIEVRIPGSLGTISILTPFNRIFWGHGEQIPVTVLARSKEKASLPDSQALELTDVAGRKVWGAELVFAQPTAPGERAASLIIPAEVVSALIPGRYKLSTTQPGFTNAGQPLTIGQGMTAASPFRITQHGDYGGINSSLKATAWDFADLVADVRSYNRTLGVNQYVQRIGFHFSLEFSGPDRILLGEIQKRLAADPSGVSARKADFGFPRLHALGAFSADGIREMLLLVGMDAALPIGSPAPWSAGIPAQEYAPVISKNTEVLKSLPGFYGWDWTANWWVVNPEIRFQSPLDRSVTFCILRRSKKSRNEDFEHLKTSGFHFGSLPCHNAILS